MRSTGSLMTWALVVVRLGRRCSCGLWATSPARPMMSPGANEDLTRREEDSDELVAENDDDDDDDATDNSGDRSRSRSRG